MGRGGRGGRRGHGGAMLKRIAIVVQRCGPDVVGGSEGYALRMARVLASSFDVDVVTTTAKDYITWENFYPEGEERVSDTLRVLRFPVDFQRDPYWHELNRILFKKMPLDKFSTLETEARQKYLKTLEHNPIGLEEEWLKSQGPYSSGLLEYLRASSKRYDRVVFMTYLYPTTYFGIDSVVEREKVLIVPTLHDEPPVYMKAFRKYLDYRFLFLTEAEKRLAERVLCGRPGSEVIGFGLDDRSADTVPAYGGDPYFLYAGRLEEAKGVGELFDWFARFSKKRPGVRLLTIGGGPMKDFRHAKIKYLGFLGEEEKLSVMKGARAFVHPSAYESLGIVLIESFMMGTPALVNARSEVLKDHVNASGGGLSYCSYAEFEKGLEVLLSDGGLRDTLGKRAREYYLQNYSMGSYKERLVSLFEPTPAQTGKGPPEGLRAARLSVIS